MLLGVGVTVALAAKSFLMAMQKMEEHDSKAMVDRLFEQKKGSAPKIDVGADEEMAARVEAAIARGSRYHGNR